jgi:hypothetical protein
VGEKMNKNEKLKIELNKKYEILCDTIITDPVEIEKFTKIFSGGFHNHSIRNMILAWMQCPEVSLLAGYKAWQDRGRNVMRGQKAIKIFAPNTRKKENEKTGEDEYYISGFRLANTFDVSQTGVPKIISLPNGRTFQVLDPLDNTGLNIGAEGYIKNPKNLYFKDFVEDSLVKVNIKTNLGGANGNTDGNNINIARRENEAAMICTLFHEEAHILLGHTEENDSTIREIKEVTAEAGAYLASTFFGIENNKSRYYIANWGGDKELLKGLGKEVIRAAEKIIKRHIETVTIAEHRVEPVGIEA